MSKIKLEKSKYADRHNRFIERLKEVADKHSIKFEKFNTNVYKKIEKSKGFKNDKELYRLTKNCYHQSKMLKDDSNFMYPNK